MSNRSTPPEDSAGRPECLDTEGFEQAVDERLGRQHDGQETTGGDVAQEQNKEELPPLGEQEDSPVNPGTADG
ncbi:hypothetical protein ACH9EU_16140 [Kocuria sp. M1R5S2]|uniref:hypothetical protein n=1 Tax=Kocuria rhizosphaerae TaxID=3376285 RepID=UPI0037A7FD77